MSTIFDEYERLHPFVSQVYPFIYPIQHAAHIVFNK